MLFRFIRFLAALVPLALALSNAAGAAEPTLELDLGGVPQLLTRDALLQRPELRRIRIPDDVAYGGPRQYLALPLAALLPEAGSATVQFTARDGFVATIPGKLLASAGQPWLAIEPAAAPWPPLKPGGASAGPFYLVWKAPRKAGVSPEQWPYQIAKISEALPLQQRYPQIRPHGNDPLVLRGLDVYAQNCAACHRINGGGDAAVGPDLNRPFNPTEYFREPFLRRLIRDPAAVRNWDQRRMPGFPRTVLADADLDALIAYLRQMASQR